MADLISIELKEIDSILGMDWLSMHRAEVDCLRKEVLFRILDGQRICFTGERNMMPLCMILALTTNRLLRKRCKAFLACAISSKDNDSNLANIPVMCRFSDVFLKELLGL